MKIQNPRLLAACFIIGGIFYAKNLYTESKVQKANEQYLKSYNLPKDEFKKLVDRANKSPETFNSIKDSLVLDKKIKLAYEYGQKSAANKRITIKEVLKKLK